MNEDLLIERLFQELISGNRPGADEVVAEARSAGLTTDALADRAYLPLVRMINALHRAEQLTTLAHEYAVNTLRTFLDEVRNSPGADATPEPQHLRLTGRRSQFVAFNVDDDQLVAHLAGPSLGEREAPIISTEINDVLAMMLPHVSELVVDLGDVQRVSGSALGLFLDLRQLAGSLDVAFATQNVAPQLAAVFQQLGLTRPAHGAIAGRLAAMFTSAAH